MERPLKRLILISLAVHLLILFIVVFVDPEGFGLQFADRGLVRFKIWVGAEFERYKDIASDSLRYFPYVRNWVEYPQLAPHLWMIFYLWVGFRFNEFTLLHQLTQIPMQVALSLLIYRISKRYTSETDAFRLSVAYNLCPLVLFVCFSRWDVMPTFVTILSLYLLLNERYSMSFLLLGIGMMLKWYPAMLLPTYIIYLVRNKTPLRTIAWYVSTFLAMYLIPTLPFLSMNSIGWVLETFSPFFSFHIQRAHNQESLPGLFAFLMFRDFTQEYPLSTLFRILHLSAPFLSPIFLLPKKEEELIGSCTIVILAHLTFANFFSPQWLVWVTPLLLVLIRTRWDWLRFWALQLVTYLEYPVLYLYSWPHNWHWRWGGMWLVGNFGYWSMVGLKFFLLLLYIVTIITRLWATRESLLHAYRQEIRQLIQLKWQ